MELKLNRFENEFYNFTKKAIKENELMTATAKLEKLEKIEKVFKYRKLGFITVSEYMRVLAEI